MTLVKKKIGTWYEEQDVSCPCFNLRDRWKSQRQVGSVENFFKIQNQITESPMNKWVVNEFFCKKSCVCAYKWCVSVMCQFTVFFWARFFFWIIDPFHKVLVSSGKKTFLEKVKVSKLVPPPKSVKIPTKTVKVLSKLHKKHPVYWICVYMCA